MEAGNVWPGACVPCVDRPAEAASSILTPRECDGLAGDTVCECLVKTFGDCATDLKASLARMACPQTCLRKSGVTASARYMCSLNTNDPDGGQAEEDKIEQEDTAQNYADMGSVIGGSAMGTAAAETVGGTALRVLFLHTLHT